MTKRNLFSYKNYILFGIGNQSKGTYELLKKNGKIYLFDSSEDKWGKTPSYCSLVINNPNKIKEYWTEDTAVVVSSIYNQYEIAKDIVEKWNIPKEYVYSYTSEYYEKNIYDLENIEKNISEIEKCYRLIADKESQQYYENSLKLRIYRDPLLIQENIFCKSKGEYGEQVTIKEDDVFIDCGAYTGDTAEYYYNKTRGNCLIHALEPFDNSYHEMKRRIERLGAEKQIIPYHCAVSNEIRNDYICYDEDEFDMGMHIKTETEKAKKKSEEISVINLDSLICKIDKVDYIKMDIEGEEEMALLGGKKMISLYEPKLMISAYHKVSDFWRLPIMIKEINPKYKIYVGHEPGVSLEMEYYCVVK